MLEHAALLHAGRLLDALQLERDGGLDLLVEADSEQVEVHDVAAHGVALLVLDDHRLAAAAVDLDVEERMALGQHGAQAGARRP